MAPPDCNTNIRQMIQNKVGNVILDTLFSGMPYKVLHIGKFYPPHRGGMEIHLRDLATAQAKVVAVEVVVANTARQSESTEIDGIRITRVGRLGTVASMPICPGLANAIRRFDPDIIHLHTPNPGAALALLLSGIKGKIVITHHADTLGRRYLKLLSDPFVQKVMKRAAAIIVTSAGYLRSSEELRPFRTKCHVIPLGIDLGQISAHRVERKPSEPPVLLAVGRLVPYKGFDVLIRAMQKIDAELVIVGTGPKEQDLRALIRREKLEKKVAMPGYVEDLTPLLQAASVFALPSVNRAEAFGLVQLEAMAARLPVVNTRIDSGVPEVSIDLKTGLTVEPGNADVFAEAVNFLLQNKDSCESFGKNARERVENEFTIDLMVTRTLALYESVLSQN